MLINTQTHWMKLFVENVYVVLCYSGQVIIIYSFSYGKSLNPSNSSVDKSYNTFISPMENSTPCCHLKTEIHNTYAVTAQKPKGLHEVVISANAKIINASCWIFGK